MCHRVSFSGAACLSSFRSTRRRLQAAVSADVACESATHQQGGAAGAVGAAAAGAAGPDPHCPPVHAAVTQPKPHPHVQPEHAESPPTPHTNVSESRQLRLVATGLPSSIYETMSNFLCVILDKLTLFTTIYEAWLLPPQPPTLVDRQNSEQQNTSPLLCH